MGNTHLLNSYGSSNTRFNPANLFYLDSPIVINMQINRLGIFERWSMPVRDSLDEILAYADYAANEFSFYDLSAGIALKTKISKLGSIGFGLYHAPLTSFSYEYSEEVRGTYRPADDEIQISKDPIVGYQNLKTDGKFMISSIGGSATIDLPEKIDFSVGIATNFIHSTGITDLIELDTLYSNVTNLSVYPDVKKSSSMFKSSFAFK